MLSEKSYTEYLESVVLALLAERKDSDADILISDDQSVMRGFEVSPINLRIEIRDHRKARKPNNKISGDRREERTDDER